MSETIDKKALLDYLQDNASNESYTRMVRDTLNTTIQRIETGIFDVNDSSLITTIESQNSQIESLKAITELAVKGLKETESLYTGRASFMNIEGIIAEIERLQNG